MCGRQRFTQYQSEDHDPTIPKEGKEEEMVKIVLNKNGANISTTLNKALTLPALKTFLIILFPY